MVYLDYNATTPVDQRVVDAMNKMHTEHFGNPSSIHDEGTYASAMLDEAREKLALLVRCNAADVIFTSGATEANNLILSSFGRSLRHDCRILYGATEHKSVITPCQSMAMQNLIDAKPIPVNSNGIIDPDVLSEVLQRYPADLVSVMMANSETGVINPIKKIAKIVHDAGAYLHCDITQAVGKIPVSIRNLGIDAATCSSHKIYGPKGCGALIATRSVRRTLYPLILGGGQERDIRSGTQNVPAIVGFAKACEIALTEQAEISEKVMFLRDVFENKIQKAIKNVTVNGKNAERLPNTSNIRIKGALADAMLSSTKNICVSSGSACSSSTMEPSHVLVAMGLDRTAADECIRISVGKQNTLKDIEKAVDEIAAAVKFVRDLDSRYMKEKHNAAN